MKKIIAFSLLGGLTLSAVFVSLNNESPKNTQTDVEDLFLSEEDASSLSVDRPSHSVTSPKNAVKTPSPKNEPTSNALSFDERQEIVAEWSDLSEFSDAQLQAAYHSQALWSGTHSNSDSHSLALDDLPLDADELEDGRTFFAANQAKVALMLPGDSVSIELPDQADTVHLDVQSVASPNEGLVTIQGRVSDQPNSSFNLTRGANYVVGHINTPTNTYSFEIHGDAGWVHESGALFTGEYPPLNDPHHDHDHDADGAPVDDGILVVHRGAQYASSPQPKDDPSVE